MLFRDRMALGVAPLFIRLALAVTFIWAGAGKLFFTDMQVQGEQAAILANMGVDIPPTGTPVEPPVELPPTDPPAGQPAESPAETTEPPSPPAGEPAPSEPPAEPPAEPPLAAPVRWQAGAFTAEQFPTPVPVRRLHAVALMLHDAAQPNDTGGALLPGWMGAGDRARYLSWIAALTEFFGGCFVALGFFTRFWALGIAFTMAMAMWLTQIGPVVAGGAPGTLGFLPALNNFDASWSGFVTLLTLLCAALSLAFSGPGPVAFDLLFAPRRGAPRAKKPSPAPSA